MALSFEESKKKLSELAATPAVMSLAASDEMIAAYESWDKPDNADFYTYYNNEYYDEKFSIVDGNKNITLNNEQINLTQEKNSQYIPFEIPRYYDGFDLSKTELAIYWVNKNGDGSFSVPVDVYCSADKIRFAWLVNDDVTAIAGQIKFEIQGSGINSQGQEYVWKTKSNDGINVIQALQFKTFVKPDESWQNSFIQKIASEKEAAESAAVSAQNAVDQASAIKSQTQTIKDETAAIKAETQSIRDSLQDGLAEEAQQAVENAMGDYALKTDLEEAIETVESRLPVVPTKVSEFENDAGYATQTYVDNSAASVGANIPTKLSQLDNDADLATAEYVDSAITRTTGNLVDEEGNALTVEAYVKQEVETVDVSDELGDLGTNEDGTTKTVVQYVESAIEAQDITGKLGNYYTKNEVDEALGNVSVDLSDYVKSEEVYSKDDIDTRLSELEVDVDLSDYYTKIEVDNKVNPLTTDIKTNADNITSINSAITTINETLGTIDKTPNAYYITTYNEPYTVDGTEYTGENTLVLYRTAETDSEEARSYVTSHYITGGSGGTESANKIVIKHVTPSSFVRTVNDSVIIEYSFTATDSAGDDIGQCYATWKIGNKIVINKESVITGTRSVDLTEYLSAGSDQKVTLTISDDFGTPPQSKVWYVSIVDVKLESNFDDVRSYSANSPVTFTFIPYGAVDKTVHFILDGEEIGTKSSLKAAATLSDSYTIPAQAHGSHLLEVYMTAYIDENNTVESNHIFKDIIFYDASSPVIGTTYQNFTARQYDSTDIKFVVHDPSTETPTVTILVDGEFVADQTLQGLEGTYTFKTDVVGKHTITITCGSTVKKLTANITKIDIDVAPVTTGLVFDFNPSGKSNNSESDKSWSYGEGDSAVSMTVSDNFDWVNGGYQYDENGDQYFCIKAGTSAEIDYQLFSDDAKIDGKEFKLVFKTTNVANSDTTFLSCVSDTAGANKIGIEMKAQEATIYAKTESLPLPYAEDEIIEFEFNINPSSTTPPMVMGYEDGVSTRPLVYDSTHDFQQQLGNRKTITLGSDECDLHIYRFKVYSNALSDREILNNFITDARSAEEMINRYNRNQIYKDGDFDPDYLAEVCPDLRVIKIECPRFTTDKSDYVGYVNIECIYKNGDAVLDNWTATDAVISGQGTSSNSYGPSGRNMDLILKKFTKKDVTYNEDPHIYDGDGNEVSGIALTRTSVPVDYFNVKVNIASSENANNALLARRYNQYNPYNRPFVRVAKLTDAYSEEEIAAMTEEEQATALAALQAKVDSELSYIKDTMEFHNCVIFIKETGIYRDGTSAPYTEFNDGQWHFYAIGNVGDSKKTDNTRLTDMDDPYECIIEVMDNTLALSTMPSGVYDENGAPVYPITEEQWETMDNPAYSALYYEGFDETEAADKENGLADTYGMRYLWEDGTDEENDAAFDYVTTKWKEFYKFVVTSSDEDFKAHLGDYCVLDSVLYYYLFTLRWTMTDNHAKNSFWHYGKSNDLDSEGNPIRKWDLCFDYDNDTAIGIDNYGRMTYRYGYEEIDYVDGTQDWVWNAPQHIFFLRIRELFDDELCTLYQSLASLGCWNAEGEGGTIAQWNNWQSQFPEELWRKDIERKYIRTYTSSYVNGPAYPDFLKQRANGRKKTQRAQFERNQEKYMNSKFRAVSATTGDQVYLRCSVPNIDLVVKPNFNVTLTPYSYVYLSVAYNTDTQKPKKIRAVPNQQYIFEYNAELADIMYIYSASCLKSLGDLSALYLIEGQFATATKINELILGNSTEGYNNTNEMTLGLGSNNLLTKLDIQNMSGLKQSLSLSGLKNLKELYALGSNVSGIVFADGGNIETAQIPDVGTLEMRRLSYLTDEGFEASSYNNLTKLVAEGSQLDLVDLINSSPNLYQVRLTDVDLTLENGSAEDGEDNEVPFLNRMVGLAGVNVNNGNTDQSVLTGTVHVPMIRQYRLAEYNALWPDLTITYDRLIVQYPVTFKDYDGTELWIQYVDEGDTAIDPVENGDIPTPTRESSVSTVYKYAGWDTTIEGVEINGPKTIIATYTESVRTYTIKYVSNGVTMQESTGCKYGDYIEYTKDKLPTLTHEENYNGYYLFKDWDKSGYVDGDKTINALFDYRKYTDDYYTGKVFKDLQPVDIYMLSKRGIDNTTMVVEDGNDYSIRVGHDVDYTDIESQLIVSDKTSFDGTNYIDTGIELFKEDRDFTLALDYEFLSGNTTNATLAQCFKTNGSIGFRLFYNSNIKLAWSSTTSSASPATVNNREMLVLRHKSGDSKLYVYKSNLSSSSILTETLTTTRDTFTDSTLVLGCAKDDAGDYAAGAIGDVHWCKVWYKDLGDSVCRKLANWTHEKIDLEVCGRGRFFLAEDSSKKCMISFLATHLLERAQKYNTTSTTEGGWATSYLNKFLNSRLYEAMPTQTKLLLKQVSVWSSNGAGSTDVSSSNCYITIPAVIELTTSSTYYAVPYINEMAILEGQTISYMTSSTARRRAYDNGTYASYLTRSPSTSYTSRVCMIYSDGSVYNSYQGYPTTNYGVLIEISF